MACSVGAQIKRVEGLLGAMTGTSAEPGPDGPRGLSNPYAAAHGKVLSGGSLKRTLLPCYVLTPETRLGAFFYRTVPR